MREARYPVSYYCSGDGCLRTTYRITVLVRGRTYYYCVRCGRRLEELDRKSLTS